MEFCLLFLFTMIASFTTAQQKVIQLYKGAAPGSENWNWDEKEATNPMNFRNPETLETFRDPR